LFQESAKNGISIACGSTAPESAVESNENENTTSQTAQPSDFKQPESVDENKENTVSQDTIQPCSVLSITAHERKSSFTTQVIKTKLL